VRLGNSALAVHKPVEGKSMWLFAILPEWIYMISEVEQGMMELGYERAGWEAVGRRKQQKEDDGDWYSETEERAPPRRSRNRRTRRTHGRRTRTTRMDRSRRRGG
jgi:hypothetical protein